MPPNLPQLFSDLVRCETELWDAVEGALRARHGILLSWYEPMQVVARTPNCRVHDIAQALAITVGGTSKIVDRIEAAGWVERGVNPLDQRSSVITLTARGRRLLSVAEKTVAEVLEGTMGAAASAAEWAQFAATVRQLRAVVRAPREG